jgi:hypothetical protein
MARVGEIWFDRTYYRDEASRSWKGKYFMIVGLDKSYVTIKLLTSQPNGRPQTPACYRDKTYPAYYMGILQPGGRLQLPTWLDLRESDDIDDRDFASDERQKKIVFVMDVPDVILCPALLCAAKSDDVTRAQERRIMDARSARRCP